MPGPTGRYREASRVPWLEGLLPDRPETLRQWRRQFQAAAHADVADEAATSLRRFAANVDTSRHGEPACLGVITSTGAAGRPDDGVHLIPISTLGP